MIAMWNGVTIAHSTDTSRVEGYHYFPPARRITGHVAFWRGVTVEP
jgi:uncharacterized protein (DUF427 family)